MPRDVSYYLLNHLSTELLALVLVGVPTLVAVLGVALVDRSFPSIQGAEMDDRVREVVGLVFGLLLALVIASIVTKADDAERATATESTAVAQLSRASRAFPMEMQIKLERALRQYVHGVVGDEWRTMRTGRRSVRASAAMETVYGTLHSFRPKGEPSLSVYRQALVQLDTMSASRRERLELAGESLPGLLRVLLVVGAVAFIALSYPAEARGRRKKMLITGSITAFIFFAYLLTVVLDHPFSGEIAVDDTAFKTGDLAIYWAATEPQPIAAGDVAPLRSRDVVGVWSSDAFGPVVFRAVDGEIRGALRLARGTVVARIEDGVLRGTWCEAPTRKLPLDRGEVQWRMRRSGGRDELIGRWRYGASGAFRGGWDLARVGGPKIEPPDIVGLFSQPSRFCTQPVSGRARVSRPRGVR